jgi:nucleoside-diphosphate-sugar epimerase
MEKGAAVCVTGVTGYLGTEIVYQLLNKGYTVHGTVRSLVSDATKELQTLFPAIKFFEADLLKEGSFDKAIEGCVSVIHAASPFVLTVKDPQTELIDPALNGTKNVLNSVEKFHTVKSVILTSSLAACVEHHPTDDGSKVWTEEDWNTTSSLVEGPYRLSKVLAERYAFEWAEKHPAIKVCTILPTFIIGPPHTRRCDATSIKFVKDMLSGVWKVTGAPAVATGMVDIRDVALAHILAFELPQAKGRYLVTSELGVPRIELAQLFKKEFPGYPVPETQNGVVPYKAGNLLPNGRYSVAKVQKDLGMHLRDYAPGLLEMAHKMIEFGLIPKPT